jgi:hypothetical protein
MAIGDGQGSQWALFVGPRLTVRAASAEEGATPLAQVSAPEAADAQETPARPLVAV